MLHIKTFLTIISFLSLNIVPMCFANNSPEVNFGIGVSAGYSYLEPKLTEGWDIDSKNSRNIGISLESDIGENLGFEIFYSDLGEVDVFNVDGIRKDTVNFKAAGFAGLLYWPSHQSDWSLFGKLGISTINGDLDDKQIELVEDDDFLVSAGAGVRWNFMQNLSSRFEIHSVSKDAKIASFMLIYSF
jgi:hypothetical protein